MMQRKKTALITGASRGLGRSLAVELARRGCVVVAAARSVDALNELRNELSLYDCKSAVFACDVTSPQQVRELFTACQDNFGHLDILINNAGLFQCALVQNTSDELWRNSLESNLSSAFYCCRAGIPLLQGHGGIIANIASIAALRGSAGLAAYSAAKAGLRAFSEAMRDEVRALGIRVTTILAGAIDTDAWKTAGLGSVPDAKSMMPCEEVARVIASLVTLPPSLVVEEVVLMPTAGLLPLSVP